MNNQKASEEIELRILDEFTKEPAITQRALADRLGIALGLVNAYVKRLYKKGHIKIKTLPRNRIKYIITPKGFTEKARLTYSYMHISINHFRDVRRRIEHIYSEMLASGVKNVLLWGDGEIAELCYISMRGLPLSIIGVVGGKRVEHGFFGNHVYEIGEAKGINYDAILVSSLEDKMAETLRQSGIPAQNVYYL